MANDNGGIIGIINTPTADTASGVWSLDSQYQAQTTGTWPPIPAIGLNSARFNSGSSDNLSRTPSSATNRKTWTWSAWVKPSNTATDQGLWYAEPDATGYTAIRFASNKIRVLTVISGSTGNGFDKETTRLFRDPSAWYHFVVAYDSTQATANDRVKIYVNGVLETDFSTNNFGGGQNLDSWINSTNAHQIGAEDNVAYYKGYMSDVNFVDGQALDPTSFGVSNSNGVWTPIPPTVSSYGTNGFRLKFENASNLGEDASPNGNNFTVNNLTSVDQTTDIPTNNFATLNPLNKADLTYADGNNKITNSTTSHNGTQATMAVSKGKWYWETKYIDGSGTKSMAGISIVTETIGNNLVGGTANSYGYYRSNGQKYNNGIGTAYGTTPSNGSIIGIAFDADNGTLWFSLDGVWQNSATISEIENGTTTNSAFSGISMSDYYAPACSAEDCSTEANFGNPAFTISSGNADGNGYGNFEYTVPSGYYSLCTKNLAEYG